MDASGGLRRPRVVGHRREQRPVGATAEAERLQPRVTADAIEPARSTAGGEHGYTAKHIEVLEGLEPVRRRPGMYIGGTDEKALHHLFAEVIDNAMDEALAGHAHFIEVEVPSDPTDTPVAVTVPL